jgi:glycosyltransferase involved in cell wall biosynthesis
MYKSIVHVLVSLQTGGAERMAISLAAQQQLDGYKVQIWSITGTGPASELAKANNLTVHCFGQKSGFDWSVVKAMSRRIKQENIQVIHTHNPMPHYYAAAAKLLAPYPVLINTRHNMGTRDNSWRKTFLYRQAMRVTKYAVSVCQTAQNNFVESGVIPSTKARFVRNGIELAHYKPSTEKSKAMFWSTLGRLPPTLTFGSIGRLNSVKNHMSMIAAFAQALPKLPSDTHLLLVGDGPMRHAIQQLAEKHQIANKVTLLGERSDIPFILSAFDVFLQSSDTEGYSLALVEAAASGLPVIATSVGGNAEIVQTGKTGLLVPAQDSNALAQAIVNMAASETQMAMLGANALEWSKQFGPIANMHLQYQSLYQD